MAERNGSKKSEGMRVGFFESHPWTLIPLVIVITEGWSALKQLVRQHLRRRILS